MNTDTLKDARLCVGGGHKQAMAGAQQCTIASLHLLNLTSLRAFQFLKTCLAYDFDGHPRTSHPCNHLARECALACSSALSGLGASQCWWSWHYYQQSGQSCGTRATRASFRASSTCTGISPWTLSAYTPAAFLAAHRDAPPIDSHEQAGGGCCCLFQLQICQSSSTVVDESSTMSHVCRLALGEGKGAPVY